MVSNHLINAIVILRPLFRFLEHNTSEEKETGETDRKKREIETRVRGISHAIRSDHSMRGENDQEQ